MHARMRNFLANVGIIYFDIIYIISVDFSNICNATFLYFYFL